MLITYFDEVKYAEGTQPYYWLGGLGVDAGTIWRLEQKVGQLSEEVFGTSRAKKQTEFHATDICARKRNFKECTDIGKRLDVLKQLADIIDSENSVAKIYVKIYPANIRYGVDPEQMAFMFFVERVHIHLKANGSPGILIGDRENDKVSGKFADELSGYRAWGTNYNFGIELTHLLDTVHFTDSAHSRMLQLADVYVWLLQLCASDHPNPGLRQKLAGYVRNATRLLSPTRYKVWPPDYSGI